MTTRKTGPALRRIVVALALIEAVAAAGFMAMMLQSSDPLGRSIGQGMAVLVAIPAALLVLPALVLGLLDRWLYAGLLLALLAIPVVVVLWGMA